MEKIIFREAKGREILIVLIMLLFPAANMRGQDELNVIRGESSNNRWSQFSDAPNSLYHHLTGMAYEFLDARADEIEKIESLPEWKERQEHLLQTFLAIIGPFPEKTPLKAKVVRKVQKEGFRIEHIIFESQPRFYVTSSMFIPNGLKEKAPVVIYTSGHTTEGYRNSEYQKVILNLVNKGFIVFAFDPVSQGERLQYFDSGTGQSAVGGPTTEHSYSGVQAFITGSSQARYMIWDGIRAVDYLITREEVDSSRIGLTGRSGGGTQTAYIAALDKRIKAAAPENYITNFTRLLQTIGPQDAEQNLPAGISKGIDHSDLLIVRAPKPTLMITTTNDFFSIQGARETAKEVREVYKAYDMEENFRMVEDEGGHISTKNNREALYSFFQKHLHNHGNFKDHEVEFLSKEELQVTQTGQVSSSLGGETVFSLISSGAGKLINELQASRENLINHIPEVVKSAKELSGYREPVKMEKPVFTGRIQRDGYVVEKYFIKGEGDYLVSYLLMVPENPTKISLIYLHPSGKAAEASPGGEIEWFVKKGVTVLVPDMVGVGETSPLDKDNELRREWRVTVLVDRSITGIRSGDVVRLTRLLDNYPGIEEIMGLARGVMAPVLLHAAAFDPNITRIALVNPYSSFRAMVMNPFYDSGFIHSTVPGALAAYDLPDLAASLAPRKLLIADITDIQGNIIPPETIMGDLSIIDRAYFEQAAGGQLTISTSGESPENLYKMFLDWIK